MIDLSQWDYKNHKIMPLTGDWEFHWKKLLTFSPKKKVKNNIVSNMGINQKKETNRVYLNVPSKWNSAPLRTGKGYATFFMKIKLPDGPEFIKFIEKRPLGLFLGGQKTSAKVFVNGKIIAEEGVVSNTIENYRASVKHSLHFLPNINKNFDLAVQIANFKHRSGGFVKPVYLGVHDDLLNYVIGKHLSDSLIMGILFIVIISNFLIFMLNRDKTIYLVFSLLSMSILIREFAINVEIISNFFRNIQYEQYLLLEYLAFFWIIPIGFHFLHALLEKEVNKIFLRSIYSCAFIFSILSLVLPFIQVTGLITYYQLLLLTLIIYFVVLLVKSKKSYHFIGNYVVIGTFVALMGGVTNDILHSRLIINTLYIGKYIFLVVIIAHNILLLKQFSLSLYRSERLNISFRRFVPQQFISLLKKEDIMDINLGDHLEQNMTVFFSDLRNFTTLSESMTPEENFNFINSYLKRMGPCIRQNHGFIDKYIGDAIMALFPVSSDHAIQATVDFYEQLEEYNKRRVIEQNYQAVEIGIGIHSGILAMGTIGESERMDTTVISDTVNLAARLESATKTYGVRTLISEATYNEISDKDQFSFRSMDYFMAKGKSKKILVYESLDCYLENKVLFLETLDTFEEGMNLFREGEKQGAKECFQTVLKINKQDLPTERYLKLCEQES